MKTTNKISSKLEAENNENQVMDTHHRLKDIINLPSEISEEEIQSFINKEIEWLRSDEYIRRKRAATGRSQESIQRDVEKILTQLKKTTLEFDKETYGSAGAGGVYSQDKEHPKMRVFEGNTDEKKHSTKHEIIHTLSEHALETGDELLRVFNREYKKYPKINAMKWHDRVNPLAMTQRWANNSQEQQVVARRIMDYIESTQGLKRGEKLSISNINDLRDDMNKFKRENEHLQKKDMRYNDITRLMLTFQRKYGDNYPNKLLELLNTAY